MHRCVQGWPTRGSAEPSKTRAFGSSLLARASASPPLLPSFLPTPRSTRRRSGNRQGQSSRDRVASLRPYNPGPLWRGRSLKSQLREDGRGHCFALALSSPFSPLSVAAETELETWSGLEAQEGAPRKAGWAAQASSALVVLTWEVG